MLALSDAQIFMSFTSEALLRVPFSPILSMPYSSAALGSDLDRAPDLNEGRLAQSLATLKYLMIRPVIGSLNLKLRCLKTGRRLKQ